MSPAAPRSGKKISDSLFNMWRCVIALAHADGEVQSEERAYIERIIGNLDRVYGLSPEQKKIFEDELQHAGDLKELLPHVKEPQDRASLVYFADIIVWADGTLSEEEEKLLKQLRDDQMSKVDMNKARTQIEADRIKRAIESDREAAKMRIETGKKSPTFAALDRLLRKLGIDMLN
ncbi:MAG: TerB family tellurite resistance protein [Alphaproteobacteria bacterium]|nr:MAG: TerB family tellurite resistance protein [Alphaproteobacteria bacterium]